MAYVKIIGIKKLDNKFKELPNKLQTKILRTALRDGAKIIQKEAKSNAPVGETGMVKKAIKVRAAKRKKGSVGVNIQLGEKDFTGKSFYGAFLEYGVKNKDGSQKIEPMGFMRAAADTKGDEAKRASLARIKSELEKEAKKN